MRKNQHICCVGTGPAGIAVASEISYQVSRGALDVKKLTIVDSGGMHGRSPAFNNHSNDLLLNQSSEQVSMNPRNSLEFRERCIADGRSAPAFRDFAPRSHHRAYQEEKFFGSINQAKRNGAEVQLIEGDVVDLDFESNGKATISIETSTGLERLDEVDVTSLAMGGEPSQRFKSLQGAADYVRAPYDAGALKQVRPESRILCLGMGLSASDITKELVRKGHSGEVTWASRTACLPNIRALHVPGSEAAYMTREFLDETTQAHESMPLSVLEEAFDNEIKKQSEIHGIEFVACESDLSLVERLEWQLGNSDRVCPELTAFNVISPWVPAYWDAVSLAERRIFNQSHVTRINNTYFPMTPASGRTLYSWLLEERVSIEALSAQDTSSVVTKSGGGFEAKFADGKRRVFDTVVDCTGLSCDIRYSSLPLMRSLYSKGYIRSHPVGGVDVVFGSNRVIDATGQVNPDLYVIGPLTKGVHFYVNSIEMSLLRAQAVVSAMTFRQGYIASRRPWRGYSPVPKVS